MRTALATKPRTTTIESPKPAPPKVVPGNRLNFGAISTKKASGRTEYEVIPDDLGHLGETASALRKIRAQITALTGQDKTLSYEVKSLVTTHAWKAWSGRPQVDSGFQINVKGEEPILVLLTSRYNIAKGDKEKSPNLDTFRRQVIGLIGEENFNRLFRDSFTVKVNGELIPMDKQQQFIDGISELIVKLNLAGEACIAQPSVKQVDEFHTLRHSLLTPEQNAKLDEIFPCTVQIRTEYKA